MASLAEYRKKRQFDASPEPRGKERSRVSNRFVVQEHHARRLHYDFRLEIDGVLKSWAVPKGPSLNPADKRLAVQTEDHPLEYGAFEGTIPAGNYGAGEVTIWDAGTFELEGHGSAREQIERGDLKFSLHGRRLRGSFVLVKIRSRSAKNEWLLIKHADEFADPNWSLDGAAPPKTAQGFRKITAKRPEPKLPAGARPAAMPSMIRPALATLTERPFSGADWLFEIKWDGLRTLAQIRDGKVRLWSRSQREIAGEYPELDGLAAYVNAREAWLDGEVVVLDSEGKSDFQKLQNRFSVLKPSAKLQEQAPAVYYLFDVLYCNGYDLRKVPLMERKALLKQILHEDARFRYSDHVVEKGEELYELAVARELEGLVAKKIASAYPEGRTSEWLKIKLEKDLDAVVGGWTDPRGSREYFGALLLGLYDGDQKLQYIGSVGSGFPRELQKSLWKKLQELKTAHSPFAAIPQTREKAYWIRPVLVGRVKFSGWTEGRNLRQPRFGGLQEDHDPGQCTFEAQAELTMKNSVSVSKRGKKIAATPKPPGRAEQELSREKQIQEELLRGSSENAQIQIDGRSLNLSNLNKIYFPDDGYTKRDLLAYYYQVAPFILPFLKDRPLVLRRYPNGIHGEAFFQKDAGKGIPEWVKTVSIRSEDKGRAIHYVIANDRPTLLYLTNLGCIDHNPWSSRHGDQEHPDYIFFDLDPTEGTPFAKVVALARAILATLHDLGFRAFAKTSGATGIHIFLPVEPRYSFEQARMFVEAVASIVSRENPGVITLERSVQKRPRGSVYVDAHQNSRGQSMASVYSARAFPHAPVSAPVKESELAAELRPEKWNLRTMIRRIEKYGDLWGNFWEQRQSLEKLLGAPSSGDDPSQARHASRRPPRK